MYCHQATNTIVLYKINNSKPDRPSFVTSPLFSKINL